MEDNLERQINRHHVIKDSHMLNDSDIYTIVWMTCQQTNIDLYSGHVLPHFFTMKSLGASSKYPREISAYSFQCRAKNGRISDLGSLNATRTARQWYRLGMASFKRGWS